MGELYLGFDIGGTKCTAVLGEKAEEKITILGRKRINTEKSGGYQTTLRKLIDAAHALIPEVSGRRQIQIKAAGISCGAPLDSKRGIILSPPNLVGWDEVPITDLISNEFGIPAFLQNDANACALAEWKFGAGAGTRNMVFLTFGTGLGAGLILDGRLYCGASGMAGEVGHIRLSKHGPVGYGKQGSFEGFCSGGGIAQAAAGFVQEQLQQGKPAVWEKGISAHDEITARDIARLAREGDTLALKVMRQTAKYLGKGLAILIDILNPECIVLGSIYARCEDLLEDEAIRVIQKEALPQASRVCRILPAGLGEQIGDYAALSVGINGIGNNIAQAL